MVCVLQCCKNPFNLYISTMHPPVLYGNYIMVALWIFDSFVRKMNSIEWVIYKDQKIDKSSLGISLKEKKTLAVWRQYDWTTVTHGCRCNEGKNLYTDQSYAHVYCLVVIFVRFPFLLWFFFPEGSTINIKATCMSIFFPSFIYY